MLLWLACACNVQGDDPKVDPREPREIGTQDYAWDGISMRQHRDRASATAFPMPATGFRVRATHFDAQTPPIKMKHEIELTRDGQDVIRIEIWNDTERLGLDGFFDKYLRFMVASGAEVETTHAGQSGAPAIVVRQPRSEQAAPRRHTVFEVDGRIVRVTAIDDTDPTTAAIYDRVTKNFELARVE
jgi:hypothetical protein